MKITSKFKTKLKTNLQLRLNLKSISYLFILSFSLFLIFSYINHTQDPILKVSNHCLCQSTSEDVWAKPLMYNYGSLKGQCVDNCERRATEVINYISDDKVIEITNLDHQNKFWRAAIPLKDIISVDVIFETFAWNTNHVSLKFNFKDTIKIALKSQDKTSNEIIWLSTNSIVFSPEAALAIGQRYSLFDGFMGRYGLIFRMYSFEQYKVMVSKLDHPTKIFKTKLDTKESQSLLLTSLLRANRRPLTTYQLVFNNCATVTLDLLLDSKKLLRSQGWDFWDVIDPLRGVPANLDIGTLRSLRWWHIIDESEPVADLENEINVF